MSTSLDNILAEYRLFQSLFDVGILLENEIFKTISYFLSFALHEYNFNELFEEYQAVMNYRERQSELLVAKEVERVIGNINAAGVMSVEFDNLDYADKAALFDFRDMEYSSGIKGLQGCFVQAGN